MCLVFDRKLKHVSKDDAAIPLAYADSPENAKAMVHEAMRRSGTGPKPKKMVLAKHPEGFEGYFVHPDEKKTWYD